MNRVWILLLCLGASACVKSNSAFEELRDGGAVTIPMKLTAVSGTRDGEIVKATIEFREGADSTALAIVVALGPPPQFISGTYRSNIGGRAGAGIVESQSLSFLGGQNALPSVGGTFILKDSGNRPVYRATLPPTPIQRQVNLGPQ